MLVVPLRRRLIFVLVYYYCKPKAVLWILNVVLFRSITFNAFETLSDF